MMTTRPSVPTPRWTRRRFLQAGTLAMMATGAGCVTGRKGAPGVIPPSVAFDKAMHQFMRERGVPGGSLAVVRDGRLVYAQGYGWADSAARERVRPDSLFRLASVSKPITAVTVLRLWEAGKLDLDSRVFELLDLGSQVPNGHTLDARWRQVTLRQLLQHTGGWDRDKSFDPMFRAVQIASALGEPAPASPRAVIRYMLGQQLDFDPGTRYAYSNFGYCLLGRVIEKVTGTTYETAVQREVLAPAGIRRMRVGASRAEGRAKGEVRYYQPSEAPAKSVFPDGPRQLPMPYGGFHLEAMDAHGGWIASAVDLARFAAALDTGRPAILLQPAGLQEMVAAPAPPVSRTAEGQLADHWYGCGWLVRPVGAHGKVNTWHSGSLPGTATLLVRRADGLSYAALFNQRSRDSAGGDAEIDPLLAKAARRVKDWPGGDLFGKWE